MFLQFKIQKIPNKYRIFHSIEYHLEKVLIDYLPLAL